LSGNRLAEQAKGLGHTLRGVHAARAGLLPTRLDVVLELALKFLVLSKGLVFGFECSHEALNIKEHNAFTLRSKSFDDALKAGNAALKYSEKALDWVFDHGKLRVHGYS
jgi:hypothetical protein